MAVQRVFKPLNSHINQDIAGGRIGVTGHSCKQQWHVTSGLLEWGCVWIMDSCTLSNILSLSLVEQKGEMFAQWALVKNGE
ncbi:hypothetical protein GDO81_020110 [Engystomops pustulosus]|uniref:Uncharacterized protein n=1 Tax=Engystomops pustulosus TaxID=76066 RepID=A0AAV6Z0T5_ENGPU|nr:hypothetical protein GDO81_020110 [Engystomops pustulosus]